MIYKYERLIRGHPQRTSAKFCQFFTPFSLSADSPGVHILRWFEVFYLHDNQVNYQCPVISKKCGLWFLREVARENRVFIEKIIFLQYQSTNFEIFCLRRAKFGRKPIEHYKISPNQHFFTWISKNTFHALQNFMKKWPARKVVCQYSNNVACAKISTVVGGLLIM